MFVTNYMMYKGLKVVMLNIRSLWPNIDEMIYELKSYDIVCLCKTWLNTNITDNMINFPGFTIFRSDRTQAKRGGGLIVYVKNKLAEYCTVISESSCMSDDLEQLWVTFNFPNQKNMNVGLVYRPPGSVLENSIHQLRTSLDLVMSTSNKENIILGYLNINYKLKGHTTNVMIIKPQEI